MAYIKADHPMEQEHFDYLEELRKSGDTNMYGASPYLQYAFGLSQDAALKALSKWMDLHHEPKRVLERPLTKQRPHRMTAGFERGRR